MLYLRIPTHQRVIYKKIYNVTLTYDKSQYNSIETTIEYSLRVPTCIGSSSFTPLLSFTDLSGNALTGTISINNNTKLKTAFEKSWRGVALFSNINGFERQISNTFYFLTLRDYYPIVELGVYKNSVADVYYSHPISTEWQSVHILSKTQPRQHRLLTITKDTNSYVTYNKGYISSPYPQYPIYFHANDEYFYTPCSNIILEPPIDTYTHTSPTDIKATPINAGAIISFYAPPYNGNSPITHYDITTTPGNTVRYVAPNRDLVNNRTSIRIDNLQNNTEYTFTVNAVSTTRIGSVSQGVKTTPANDIGYGSYNYFVLYYHGAREGIELNNLKFFKNGSIISPIKYTVAQLTNVSDLGIQISFKRAPNSATEMAQVLQTNSPAGKEWGIGMKDISGNNLSNYINITNANDSEKVIVLPFKTNMPITFEYLSFKGNIFFYKYFKIYGGLSLNGEIPSNFDELYEYGYSNRVVYDAVINGINYGVGYDSGKSGEQERPLWISRTRLPAYLSLTESLQSYNIITNATSFVTSLQGLTTLNSQPLLLSSIGVNTTNLLSLQGTSKKTARTNLLNAIFSARTDATKLILKREELGLSSTLIQQENVFVAKPKTIINLNSELSSTTSVYSSLDTVGDFNTYTYNNIEFTITNTGNDPVSGKDTFSITGDETIYYTDDVLRNYNGLTIVFGSVEIANATIAMHNVSVNFQVEIDASGNLNIFGKEAPVVQNVIVAQRTLPVNALYDSSNRTGLIEFWEPSDNPDTIKVQLANTHNVDPSGSDLSGAYQVHSKLLAKGLEYVLCDAFDCSNASPFKSYTDKVEYTMQRDFGRVALGCFAHYLFGHVDATSAITNDIQFIQKMLSLSNESTSVINGTAEERYNAYNNFSDISNNLVKNWDVTQTNNDANLARRLVSAIVNKGITTVDGTLTISEIINGTNTDLNSLANIVAQVVGQDASRLMNEDNNERTINMHIPLRFIPGDVIYVNIKLAKPTIQVGSGQNVLRSDIEGKYNKDENYTLKITLGDNNSGL